MGAPPGKPHNKPTREEKREIQQYVYHLLVDKAMYAGEIKDLVSAKYEKSKRSVEPYISRARKKMREEAGKDKEDLRAESYHFYHKIANDPNALDKDRIRARERIDKLLAVDMPAVTRGENLNFNVDIDPKEIQDMTDDELVAYKDRLLNRHRA